MPLYRLATPEFDEHSAIVSSSCGWNENGICISWYEDIDNWEAMFSFHLKSYGSVFRRIWTAVRYIFGYRCRYGDWDEVLLDVRTSRDLIEFLQEYVDQRTLQKSQIEESWLPK